MKIFGVEEGCSEAELKKAHHKLGLHWHPDKNPTAPAWIWHTIQDAYNRGPPQLSNSLYGAAWMGSNNAMQCNAMQFKAL